MITFPSNMTAPKIGVPSLLSARGKPPVRAHTHTHTYTHTLLASVKGPASFHIS